MKKPMLFWIASALPISSLGQAWADIAENCGESDIAAAPQNSSAASATPGGASGAISG